MIINIEQAIVELQNKNPVIIFDNEGENEGDVVFPSEIITEENIKFMMNYCKGVICQTLKEERIKELEIPIFKKKSNNLTGQTNFVYPVDHKKSQTGISCKDRYMIIRDLIDPSFDKENLVIPGHQNLLKISTNGILERQGHTEASSELVVLAGYYPSATICELVDDEGIPRDLDSCKNFSTQHNIPIVLLNEIYEYFLKEKQLCILPKINYIKNTYKYLAHKTAVVFGGFSGIGKQVVSLLEKNDCNVFSLSRRNGYDITNSNVISKFFQMYNVDFVINCSGYISEMPIGQLDMDDFHRHFDVNFFGIVNIIDQVQKTQKHTTIINISSPSAKKFRQNWSAYSSSKAALDAFTLHAANELTNHKIFTISPSKTKTPMIYKVFPDIKDSQLIDPVDLAKLIINIICQSNDLKNGTEYSITKKL